MIPRIVYHNETVGEQPHEQRQRFCISANQNFFYHTTCPWDRRCVVARSAQIVSGAFPFPKAEIMSEQKPSIHELLKNYAALTRKQYGTARDGGFTAAEAIGKNYDWYEANRHLFTTKSHKDSSLPKQIAYLRDNCKFDENLELTYGQARHAIRELAKLQKSDAHYLEFIQSVERDNQQRNERRKRQQETEKKLTSGEAKAAAFLGSGKGDGDDEDDDAAFFLSLKRKVS